MDHLFYNCMHAINFVSIYVIVRPEKSTFVVPIENITSKVIPKRGDVVSFSYMSYSSRALPVAPNIFRVRADTTWERVLAEYEEEENPATELNGKGWEGEGN